MRKWPNQKRLNDMSMKYCGDQCIDRVMKDVVEACAESLPTVEDWMKLIIENSSAKGEFLEDGFNDPSLRVLVCLKDLAKAISKRIRGEE